MLAEDPKALIPHAFRHLVAPLPDGAITLERFRFLLGWPNWSIMCDSISASRRYDVGFDIASLLFRATWQFENQLSAHEFDRALHLTSVQILDMLDRGDRWSDYISWFCFLRDYSTLHVREHRAFLRTDYADQYLVRWAGEHATLRYMYHYHPRFLVVSRKLARQQAGRSTAHFEHAPAEALRPEEVRDRLERVFGFWRFKQEAEAYWDSYYGRTTNA